MKKAVILAVLMMTINAATSMAIHDPSWERPVMAAEMTKISATGSFRNAEGFTLTVTKRDGERDYTGMILDYTVNNCPEGAMCFVGPLPRQVVLEITDAMEDGCGSVEYVARLRKADGTSGGVTMGARFSLRLVDHSNRFCKDLVEHVWEASIREGFGWCGTMDSTLRLGGNPEAVYTIQ